MTINFYVNNSEPNKINKSLTAPQSLQGNLRNETEIMNPSILIQNVGKPNGNYFQIPEFGRYYFITDIRSVRDQLWMIRGHVDVLKSFASNILAQQAVLDSTQAAGGDVYFNHPVYQTNVKRKTDIVNFPNGLLDSGTFILITAGGVAS